MQKIQTLNIKNKNTPRRCGAKKIGNTTFIVNSFFPEQVKDGVVSKIERLIKDDVKRKVTTN